MWENEKALRLKAENQLRAFRRLLLELAMRLDGELLEEKRRANPMELETWGAEEWRDYFAGLKIINLREAQKLMTEVEELRCKVASLSTVQATSDNSDNKVKEKKPPAKWMPPKFLPDLARMQRERAWLIFQALAEGKCLRVEILERIGNPKAGNLRELVSKLERLGFIKQEKFYFDEIRLGLAILVLTPQGRKLLEEFGVEVKESEYEKLAMEHQHQPGEEMHTMLVLSAVAIAP